MTPSRGRRSCFRVKGDRFTGRWFRNATHDALTPRLRPGETRQRASRVVRVGAARTERRRAVRGSLAGVLLGPTSDDAGGWWTKLRSIYATLTAPEPPPPRSIKGVD